MIVLLEEVERGFRDPWFEIDNDTRFEICVTVTNPWRLR